jgi:hypothetical protein
MYRFLRSEPLITPFFLISLGRRLNIRRMETKEYKGSFTLPNEIVIVKYINRRRGMAANVEANHVIAGGMLTNAVRKFSAPLQRNGSIKNVLTNEEKLYLESVTGLDLSIYNTAFWGNFRVALHKEDANNRFDLSNPMDYVSIKILESLSKEDIALTWANRNKNQTYQFAISRENEEMMESKGKYDSKRQAFMLYGKIMDDREQLIGVLKLLTNKPISKDSSLEWIQHKVEEYIDTMPSLFVNAVNDKAFYTKLLINTAIDKGVVIKKANKYSTIDGLDLCNSGEIATFDNAVKFLDDVKNQEIRLLVEAKINKK